ncbi:hypothetical protein ACOBQB_22640 [Streptomyces sp. G5(2025)]|uniref:hypothetical protein n=1 Tax=Streptomyces sp. G5(2025) TaxID=3406628 RepID=UPI003C2696C1
MTSPTPSRPRPDEADVEPELRTDTERDVDEPDRERESRPETDRREDCEWDERDEREEWEEWDEREDERVLELPEPRDPLPPPVMPVGGELTPPSGATTGARPHVSQYSSPPPTSSYDPVHPGR